MDELIWRVPAVIYKLWQEAMIFNKGLIFPPKICYLLSPHTVLASCSTTRLQPVTHCPSPRCTEWGSVPATRKFPVVLGGSETTGGQVTAGDRGTGAEVLRPGGLSGGGGPGDRGGSSRVRSKARARGIWEGHLLVPFVVAS